MDSNKKLLERFDIHFKNINESLEKTFSARIPMVDEIGRYALLGEGKRLRPLLFVLSGIICGYKGNDLYELSTIFEYIHVASLLHDDVIDNAETRRKKPSASHLWGNSAAVLTGDYLSSRAASIAVNSNNNNLVKLLLKAGERMSEGQSLELACTNKWDTGRDQYLEIITCKTGELMSAACSGGAVVSGVDKNKVDNLKEYGLNLGIAFQLVDDLLDYTSSEEQFGKPVGKDLMEGKITLPLIYAILQMDKKELLRVKKIFQNNEASEKDYGTMTAFVRESGVIDRIRSEARDYVKKASEYLDIFPASQSKEDLVILSKYISERTY
ncbi:MAG: polyprenyl synthetase family protein [Deltaproteobacteria bacterium]|nr:polyprenyl synthetase family protein [Deltaproteobacteria bacterium]